MANYKPDFDAATAEARRVVVNNIADIRTQVPGFFGKDFDRLSKSISKCLERIDKGNIDHPEFLAFSGGNYAQHAVNLMQGVPASIESGSAHFAQVTLASLVQCEINLERAIGSYYQKASEVRARYVREVEKLALETEGFYTSAMAAKNKSADLMRDIAEMQASSEKSQAAATVALKKIEEVRDAVAKLASGDGRGKSLEALKRQAEEKLATIEGILRTGQDAQSTVASAEADLKDWLSRFEEADTSLADVKARAESALALSSQAGLAASYKKEAERLAWRSLAFTTLLYVVTGVTLYFAIAEILPGMAEVIEKIGPNFTSFEALSLAILRSLILLPLIYVIYFTSKRVDSLEILRMDYSEKSAASLAYSGYLEQMNSDDGLMNQLKASLLVKFNEHPERLLGKNSSSTKARIKVPGYEAATEFVSAGRSRLRGEADRTDADEE